MKTKWTNGVKDKQVKEDIQSSFKSGAFLRARLEEMLRSKMEEKERSDMKAEGYECANWAFKMADSQGYKRAMAEIISLISDK